jgi:glutamate-5-semialdehyde dehydrogenase
MRQEDELLQKAAAAKKASLALAKATTDQKNAGLRAIASAIREAEPAILDANRRDCAAQEAAAAGQRVELDRLRLTPERVSMMAHDVEAVAALADPVGQEFDRVVRPNGLEVSKRRVPFGVVGVVYESRPNVTSDVVALCLKTGNAAVLRGGKEALESNRAIAGAIQTGLRRADLPSEGVGLVTSTDRGVVQRMLKLREYLDVIIPRGGAGLIKAAIENATVPIIETGAGVCHTYVDRAANLEMALRVVNNAKTRRPTICNALDTVLVHRDVAASWLPLLASQWQNKVEMHADDEAAGVLESAGARTVKASAADWGREFLALVAGVKVVGSLDEALEHIRQHGSGHSDAIVTEDPQAATRFVNEVDSAAVFVNASTQFTDGGEFGLGAEIGISTQKLHARGPMGLTELTTYKWIVKGAGQTRA